MDIYGTIGPSCADQKILEQMIEAGMTGIRLNLSHTTIRAAADDLAKIRAAAEKTGREIELLIDMQGPELRIGPMDHLLSLKENQVVSLQEPEIPVPEQVLSEIRRDDELLLDDGKILLRVLDKSSARVIRGGTLSGRKSIAIVGRSIDAPTLTVQDMENIRAAAGAGVTAVMQPFVRSRADLMTVRRVLDEHNGSNIRLFAKVENLAGVRHLREFFGYADEIVIARGDLGNAMPLWELPAVQKSIASECRAAGVPFMVVTQMLASMENSPVPTRAEVSDIYNAVLDGAASVMVTAETAVGAYPVEAIRYLSNTVQAARNHMIQGCCQVDG